MKWCMLMLAALMLVLPLMGCSNATAPERTVSAFLDKLIKGDIRGAEKTTVDGTLNLDKSAAKLYSPLFGALQYSVSGSVIEDDTARVSITVLVIDMQTLMTDISADVMHHMLSSGGKTGDDYFYDLLLEKLESGVADTITYSATAQLIRENGKWKINLAGSGGFADAITGGMGKIIGY